MLLVDFKASNLSHFGHFLFYCPFKGRYFSSVDLKMGVHIRMSSFRRENARTKVWCLLMGDVHLQEVSVSGGLTLTQKILLHNPHKCEHF